MCGRVIVDYELLAPFLRSGALAPWFAGSHLDDASSWNIAPTGRLPVAFTDPRTAAPTNIAAHWSLVPRSAPQLSLKYPTFNARSETAADKPTFRRAVRFGRCVVPVTGFYEWTGPAKARVPYAITGPEPGLMLAALMEWWQRPGSTPETEPAIATVSLLTTASHGVMAGIHDRMPVFMHGDEVAAWLDPRATGSQELLARYAAAARPLSEQLTAHQVAPLRGDGPHLCDAVAHTDHDATARQNMLW